MNRLFVRQYLEERELTAWLLVDLSPSMAFGTRRRFKRELAIEFAGVAAYIITRHGDKVGAIAFPGPAVPLVPPRTGRRHALRLIHSLSNAVRRRRRGDRSGRDAARAGRESCGAAHLVFVVSDFIAGAGWEGPLRDLGRRHDVVSVWVRDPAEEASPTSA